MDNKNTSKKSRNYSKSAKNKSNNQSNMENTSKLNAKNAKAHKKRAGYHYVFSKEWKMMYIPIISVLSFLFVLSVILICVMPYTPPDGGKSKSGWPYHVVAPFVDLSSWVPIGSQYSLNGVPNMGLVEEHTGISYYNLGFIQPDMSTPLDSKGNIRWGWGGLYKLSEKGNDGYQYPKIKQTITELEKMGAKYTISIGGQLGAAPWIVTTDVDKLTNFYLDVINTYNLKRMDLDIEESNQTHANNIANAKAIKKVQDQTGIEIVLTIPIMPNGWQEKQINIIRAYLDQGVNIALINSMTMCYGTGVYANEDYGDASIRAIENSIRQMKEIWASYGTNLTDAQAYAKTGATVDIGYESDLYPIFTTEMTKKVVAHAKQHKYGMVSYWSINRDAKMDSNKGVKNQYEFLKELNGFYM